MCVCVCVCVMGNSLLSDPVVDGVVDILYVFCHRLQELSKVNEHMTVT